MKAKHAWASCVILWLVFSVASVFAGEPDRVPPDARPVTLCGFGHRVLPRHGAHGDTWDSAWLADDRVFVQHDDGSGWGKGSQRGVGELFGTPEDPTTISGVDLNPGKFGKFLTFSYSTGIYDVDGVIYHIKCYSRQQPGNWLFHSASIYKSVDGGANWINRLGQTNTPVPNKLQEATFPHGTWQQVNFVKYGKGGAAPDVDNARAYVYLTSYLSSYKDAGFPDTAPREPCYYLARIKRSDLPSLDRAKIQFHTGGDGMLDKSWTDDIAKGVPISCKPARNPMTVIYNFGLRRYISVGFRSDSWVKPPVESTLYVLEAPHPWGPWTQVLEENVDHKEGDNLTWTFPLQKFTSADGTKMWITTCGRKPYGLAFMPIYLTTHPVQFHEAESAALKGTAVERAREGFTGTGYVAGFDAAGDECVFTVKAHREGAYIVKIRYNTKERRKLDFLVNGMLQKQLKLGKSEQVYAVWTEMSMFAWLAAGENTVAFRCGAGGEAADVNLDSLALAFYSDVPGSLPDCRPAETK